MYKRQVLVSNYSGGSLAVWPLDKDGAPVGEAQVIQHTGKGRNPARQEGPHVHSITLTRDEKFAVTADLGLDELVLYPVDKKQGRLKEAEKIIFPTGEETGPRLILFNRKGDRCYVAVSYTHLVNVQLTGVRINDPDEIFSYNGNENGVVQPDEDGQYCIRAKSEEESKTGSADVFLSFAGVADEYQDIKGEWQFSLTANTEKYCVDSAYSTQKGQMICGSGQDIFTSVYREWYGSDGDTEREEITDYTAVSYTHLCSIFWQNTLS